MVVENYPQLTSTSNFRALMDEISGTENRIQYERNEYNDAVATYERKTRMLPGVVIAGMLGFDSDRWSVYRADAYAQSAPKTNFDHILTPTPTT